MYKPAMGAAAVGAALAITASMGSTALAANHTVSVAGSSSAGSHLFFGSSKDIGIDFVVTSGGVEIPMSCDDVNVEGEVYSGTYDTDANPVAIVKPVTRVNTPETFAGSTWKDCVGPLGVAMTVDMQTNMEIYAPGPTITGGNSDVISGYVSGPSGGNIVAHVYATSGGPSGTACNFLVEGLAEGSFNEGTQQLTVAETGTNLSVTTVTGNCFGLIAANSPASFDGVFDIGPDVAGNTKDEDKETWTDFPILIS